MAKGYPRGNSKGNPLKREIIKQTFVVDTTVDITGVADAVDAGEVVIGDLPEGNILFLGAVSYLKFDATGDTDIGTDYDGDYAIGTVSNSNDVDLGDAGEADIIASTPIASGASDRIVPRTRGASTASLCGAVFDNTDGSLELNLNVLIDDNDITDTATVTLAVTGELIMSYIMLGDD